MSWCASARSSPIVDGPISCRPSSFPATAVLPSSWRESNPGRISGVRRSDHVGASCVDSGPCCTFFARESPQRFTLNHHALHAKTSSRTPLPAFASPAGSRLSRRNLVPVPPGVRCVEQPAIDAADARCHRKTAQHDPFSAACITLVQGSGAGRRGAPACRA